MKRRQNIYSLRQLTAVWRRVQKIHVAREAGDEAKAHEIAEAGRAALYSYSDLGPAGFERLSKAFDHALLLPLPFKPGDTFP